MKKIFIIVLGMLMAVFAYSQTFQTWTETFDSSTVSFSATPANSWTANSTYYAPNSTGSNPKSFLGKVPNTLGSTSILETKQPYNFSTMSYIFLRFDHICKVSPRDTILIQYKEVGTNVWENIPAAAYLGTAANYSARGFNAASYPEWQQADSTALPQQATWWKSEIFDLSTEWAYGQFDLRFIIKRGQVQGTNASYGWLIDNIQISANTFSLKPPIVEFISPLIKDTVPGTGPHEINARVKSSTNAPIVTPYLKYTAVFNNTTSSDSILMTVVRKDSLWKAEIPKFPVGTEVTYSILGRDTFGNQDSAKSKYIIDFPPPTNYAFGGNQTSTASDVWVPLYASGGFTSAWTSVIYLASELGTTSKGGVITHLAWDVMPNSSAALTIQNQRCYFEVTNATTVTNTPQTTATQVYQGSITLTSGWAEVILDNPFTLPAGQNLIVYWYYGHTGGSSRSFRRTNGTANRSCDAPYGGTGSTHTYYPNARFTFKSVEADNSVAASDIDIKDTVTVKPGVDVPVYAVIKNMGKSNLISTIINWTVNGGSVNTFLWYGNIYWDFSTSDSIGKYTPKLNGQDTIKLWVSYPNGGTDPETSDDTITKIIYGSSDIAMSFVNYYEGAVTHTGPYPISARITALSGAAIGTVNLVVDTTSGGTPASYTLPMTYDAGADLYRTTIPHTIFGTTVTYSITLIDALGNVVPISKQFVITRLPSATGNNSVAIVSINTPESGGVKSGDLIPVHITIRNKGLDKLTSCTIEWFKGGVLQNTKTYTNASGLPDDFTDTITVDYYQPVLGQRDLLEVRVSLPNGQTDPVTGDDAAQVSVLGCAGTLQGERSVYAGGGGDYSTIAAALTDIRDCGLVGDLTLKLKGTFTENVSLSSYTPYLKGYHLTITSWNNNADSAIIKPASGVGIALSNTNNITLKTITIDVKTGTYGVQLVSACSNIVIRECNILTNPTTTSTSCAPIYKGSGGIVDSIFIIKNTLDGGYYGIYFYGGTGTGAYGTNIVVDSNKITNQYYYGIYLYYYNDVTSCSYNTILSRTSGASMSSYWYAIYLNYSNGPVIGNYIKQQTTNTSTYPVGIYLNYHNYYPSQTQNRGLVANNEIMLLQTYYYGIYVSSARSEIINNSIYISGTLSARGIYIINSANNDMVIKNNNIVLPTATSGYPIQFSATGNLTQYNIDYNNYYAPNYVGYYNGAQASLGTWQAQIGADLNSVRVSPAFMDITTNLDLLASEAGLFCPIYPSVTEDIEGKTRTGQATMGAYQVILNARDLALTQFVSWNPDVVNKQIVSVDISVRNFGLDTVKNAVFGWSKNGLLQASYRWRPSTPLAFLGQENITVGSLTIDNTTDTYDIVVWLDSLNNNEDMRHSNDTLQTSATRMPLAAWAEPFIEDTVSSLSFTVTASIQSATGAPISTPKLMITTTVNNQYVLYDSVTLIKNGSTWEALIPEQYFNSMVVYSLTVEDSVGNTITIVDSTCIQFGAPGANNSALIIGTGTGTGTYPYSNSSGYVHSQMYYMDYEIDPKRRGGYIRSIGFYNASTGSSTCSNITFYLQAVTDSVFTRAAWYIGPPADSVTMVCTGSLTVQNGWNIFTIQAPNNPFYLPPGMNLVVTCDNSASTYSGTSPAWQYTTTSVERTSISSGGPFPHTDQAITTSRPNIMLDIYNVTPYQGHDLLISSLVSPTNEPNTICADDYSPVKVVLTNLGSEDYDFTQDNISIGYEISDQTGHFYSGQKTVNTGGLESTESDTIEIMSALPIMYSGTYNIKVWVTSPIDNVIYDDTSLYVYTSSRIGLPLDEDFSNAALPMQFVSRPLAGTNTWEPYSPNISDPVQPDLGNGTGVLRFEGTAGSMSLLSTRQLDLYGSVRPQLEFWYYHDASIPETDDSYMVVNIMLGNVRDTTIELYKRDVTTGWKHYTLSLNKYTGTSQCLLVQFEAMNKYAGSQYIDRIIMTSEQNLAVSEILISPEASVCSLDNENLSVVLKSVTNQNIDFTTIVDSLIVEVPGYPAFVVPLKNVVAGLSSDTIPIGTIAIPAGVKTTIKAYVMYPVDGSPVNDTATREINIQPELSITVNSFTGGTTNCFKVGIPIKQTVVLQNIGNVDLEGIEMELLVTGDNYSEYVKDTRTIDLAVGKDTLYTFESTYTVPAEVIYQVTVTASLGCNPALINVSDAISECADMHDLFLIGIENPPLGRIDSMGSIDSVTVLVGNRDDHLSFTNVTITAQIEDENGIVLNTLSGNISTVNPSDTISYTFTERYTVPSDSIYFIRVYLVSKDFYPENDTLFVQREIEKDTDLSLTGIENPSSEKDAVGSSVQVSVNILNSSKSEDFTGINISVLVKNSQGEQTANFTETTGAIGRSSTVNHTFNESYTVPNDTVYYLTVYIDSYDNYPYNDTLKLTRYTESVGVTPLGAANVFTLGQNIPNPATNSTRIDYSVPEAGEVIFYVHSISGQLLYSEIIEASRGTNTIELNTTTFAASVYFYSIEYKGERRVKRMNIK
jgi:hypothetical protein